MIPSLDSALNIQAALLGIRKQVLALYAAAEAQAPDATPEIYNVIESIDGALKDIAPYAQKEHDAWIEAEYARQQKGYS